MPENQPKSRRCDGPASQRRGGGEEFPEAPRENASERRALPVSGWQVAGVGLGAQWFLGCANMRENVSPLPSAVRAVRWLVYYMSPGNPAPKSCKYITYHSLLIASESPLSRSPGYLVSYRASHLHGSRAGRSQDHLPDCAENPPDNCLLDHLAGNSRMNLQRHREDDSIRSPTDHCADRAENHLEKNPAGNSAGNLTSCLVDSPVNHLHDNSASCLQGPSLQLAVRRQRKSASVHKCSSAPAQKRKERPRGRGIECRANLWNRCDLWMVSGSGRVRKGGSCAPALQDSDRPRDRNL